MALFQEAKGSQSVTEKIREAFAKYGLPPLNIRAVKTEHFEESVEMIVANELYKIVSDIVFAGAKNVQDDDAVRKPVYSEINLGFGVKAVAVTISTQKYANTCIINDNIRIGQRLIPIPESVKGRNETGLVEVFINVGEETLFEAIWGWKKVDKKSLRIHTTPEARAAYAAVYEAWLKLNASR
jgi:hypothetical protein